jgi:hypothetical protein
MRSTLDNNHSGHFRMLRSEDRRAVHLGDSENFALLILKLSLSSLRAWVKRRKIQLLEFVERIQVL